MLKPRQHAIFRSLKTELTCWFLLLALVPLVVISSIDYWQARASLIESAAEQLKQQSENKKLFIDSWFDYRWMDLNHLVDTELNVQFLEVLSQKSIESKQSPIEFVHSYIWAKLAHIYQADLVEFARRYDYIYDIFLIDSAGNILFSVAKESDLGTNLIYGAYANTLFSTAVQRSLTTGETVFSDFERYAPSAGLEAGFISAPLINSQGERTGAVAIQIRLDRIQSTFNVLTKHDTLHYLTASDGILRTTIDDENEVLIRNIGNSNSALEAKFTSDGAEKVKSYIGARGNKVIGITHQIKVWNVDWILVSEIDEASALASANWLGKFVLLALFITTILVTYLALIISRRITHPIRELAQATELMENGELDKPVVLNASNEIGRLVDAFNKMMISRKSHEEALLKEKLNAEQASIAKSEFLACMSHEIRTPMNGVLGMISLTLNSEVNAEQKRKLLIAQSSAQSLLTLINDILDYSKIEAGKLELEILDFNLSYLLGETATASALKSNENGVELILDIGQIPPDMTVKGDPSRLRQILVNLLGNANKFTNKGEIILSANIETLGDSLRLTCAVTDTGIGIPEDKIDHLFDSFSQVDASTTRKFGGTGLGLAICLRLIKLTGGDIRVQSEYGVGSTFEFDMMLAPSSVIPNVKPAVTELKANILILDDNTTNREIFKAQIEDWGGKVTEASSVDDALAICHSGLHFDAAIVDMQMPDKSGIDFAKAVKANPTLANMKLLLLSSIDEPAKLPHLKELGFSASLTKPVIPLDLYESLSFLLNSKITFNDPKQIITPTYLRSLKTAPTENLAQTANWAPTVKILLVEDNRINQEVVKGMLKHFNLTCDFANNGLEALETLLKSVETSPYTLVLMDCQMPEMDGYQATKNIRLGKAGEHNKNIPIIAMTANAMQGDREKCLDAGMNDYLTKPLDSEKVLTTLRQWLDHAVNVKSQVNTIETKEQDNVSPETVTINQVNIPNNLSTFDFHNAPPQILSRSPKLFFTILAMYLEDNQQFADNLLRETKASNFKAVRHLVHSIKGTCGNLGMVNVYKLAQNMEEQLIANNAISITSAEQLIEVVKQSFNDARQILNENGQADKQN